MENPISLMIDTPFFLEVETRNSVLVPSYMTLINCNSPRLGGVLLSSLLVPIGHCTPKTFQRPGSVFCSTIRRFYFYLPPWSCSKGTWCWYSRSWGVLHELLSERVTCSVCGYTHDCPTWRGSDSDSDVASGSLHIVSSLGNLLLEARSWINGGTTLLQTLLQVQCWLSLMV